MRVLCTVTGSPSHARAVLPFARALAAAGHEVVAACPEELAATFDDPSVRVAPVMPPMSAAVQHIGPVVARMQGPPDMAVLMPLLFAGPQVVDAVRGLQAFTADFPPDLVLRDGTEVSGLLLAEQLGVPHLPVPSGGGNVLTPDQLAPALSERRRDLGMPEPEDPAPLHRYGRLDCMPAAYSLALTDAPAWRYRQDDEVARGEVLPSWIGELPVGRPLVLAALGTALPMMAGGAAGSPGPPADPAAALRTILAGLAELDCDAVVATGGLDVSDVSVPAHVRTSTWVPQPLILQCADLFLTHGGYNGVREAVRCGTPLAVLPQFGDQEHNADRLQELGLGRRCSPTAESVTATCAALLGDGAVRAEMRRAQRAMLALPPVDACIGDLEELVAARHP